MAPDNFEQFYPRISRRSRGIFLFNQFYTELMDFRGKTFRLFILLALAVICFAAVRKFEGIGRQSNINSTHSNQRVELVAQRGRTSRVYKTGDRYASVSMLTPIHYASAADPEAYETIDMTPERVESADFDGWQIEKNEWQFGLGKPAGATEDGWVSFGMRQNSHAFQSRLVKMGMFNTATKAWRDAAGDAVYDRGNVQHAVNRTNVMGEEINATGEVSWDHLWNLPEGGDVSARWLMNGTSMREDIMLNSAGRGWVEANILPDSADEHDYFGFLYEVAWDNIPRVLVDGELIDISGDIDDEERKLIELKDDNDGVLAALTPSVLKVEGVKRFSQPLRKYFFQEEGKYYLFLGVRAGILPELPEGDLIFDPDMTIEVSAAADDAMWYWNGSSYTYMNAGADSRNWWGAWDQFREWGYMRFALSSAIPDGSIITNATVTLVSNGDNYLDEGQTINLFVTDSADAAQATTAGTRPSFDSGSTTLYPSSFDNGVDWAGGGSFTWPANYGDATSASIASLIQYLVDTYSGLSEGAYVAVWGAATNVTGDQNDEVGWYNRDGTTGHDPYIYIEWTTNSTPAISSVSDSPDPIVADNSVTFSVNWADDDAGENIKAKICKTDSLTSQNCDGGFWATSTAFTTSDPEIVTYAALEADIATSPNSYYAFVCDDEGVCSSSSSGSFSVNTPGFVPVKMRGGSDGSMHIRGSGSGGAVVR